MNGPFAVLLASLAVACTRPAPPPVSATAAPPTSRSLPPGRITDHVVIISIDGLRPDAIAKFAAPTMLRLMREGAYARGAQTVIPSTTLPSHASMLTGVDTHAHGVTWNTDETRVRGPVRVPTVFSLAHAAGFRTAAFFGKSKLRHLDVPATLDHIRSPEGRLAWLRSAERTVDDVKKHLERARPNLLFVHFVEPDYAGHVFGWMGRVYGRAVRRADRAVAAILDQADLRYGRGEYTVILTADHGGRAHTHGTADSLDTTIPWIAWGEGVRAGVDLPRGVRTMDTAATALWLLGVPAPAYWTGRPVTQAFDTTAVAPAH